MGSGGNAAGSGATQAGAVACTYGPRSLRQADRSAGPPAARAPEAARQHCLLSIRKSLQRATNRRARAEHNRAIQRRYAGVVASSLGWDPQPGWFHLFAVDIGGVTVISYDPGGSGDQHVAMWPPGREFIRRATSPTSVGDPEPVSDLIEAS
jgi:hypothetical protein